MNLILFTQSLQFILFFFLSFQKQGTAQQGGEEVIKTSWFNLSQYLCSFCEISCSLLAAYQKV